MPTPQSSTSGWLPAGYELPTTSGNYTKLEKDIETRIRVLSKPIIGWEYFQQDGEKRKPVRSKKPFAIGTVVNAAISTFTGKPDNPQEFWAFVVWNYNTNSIEIFQTSKKVIKEAFTNIDRDPDYGSPETLDIKITKTGSGKDTKYSILPSPPKPVSEEILEEYKNTKVNLEELFTGGNPFGGQSAPTEPVADIKVEDIPF